MDNKNGDVELKGENELLNEEIDSMSQDIHGLFDWLNFLYIYYINIFYAYINYICIYNIKIGCTPSVTILNILGSIYFNVMVFYI